MTRIPDDFNKGGPVTPETPSTSEEKLARRTQEGESVTAPDFLRLLQGEVASLPNRQLDTEVLSRIVVDWWLRHHVPSRAWPTPVLEAFREQVVQLLQRDPLLQVLVQKLLP